jgi:hypothetical protein
MRLSLSAELDRQGQCELRRIADEQGAGLECSRLWLWLRDFFVGYLAAQLPSVLLLERVGVRLWIFLITGAWGLAATALAFIEGREAFYALRIALGIAEAGLAPCMMLYLSRWSGSADGPR